MVAYVRRHLQGHIQYFGVSGNSRSLQQYGYQAGRLLFKWLNRRSQRKSLTWEQFYSALAWVGWPSVRRHQHLDPVLRPVDSKGY